METLRTRQITQSLICSFTSWSLRVRRYSPTRRRLIRRKNCLPTRRVGVNMMELMAAEVVEYRNVGRPSCAIRRCCRGIRNLRKDATVNRPNERPDRVVPVPVGSGHG